MWTPCPQVLDEPVKIFGLEIEDFTAVALTPMLAGLFLESWQSFACAGVLGVGLYRSKRGRAPGALLHRAHQWELVRLPGILSPRPTTYSPW